jgi:hypothetical protein
MPIKMTATTAGMIAVLFASSEKIRIASAISTNSAPIIKRIMFPQLSLMRLCTGESWIKSDRGK